MNKSEKITLSQEQLQHILEPLIRRVIREELSQVVQQKPGVFFLRPDMPLYNDMQEIAERKAAGTIELFSHQELWNE